jgi:deoxyribodipyrimidine photo-lyase
VRRWLAELAPLPGDSVHLPWEVPASRLAAAGLTLGEHYPERIVDHAEQRERSLAMFAQVKSAAAASSARART